MGYLVRKVGNMCKHYYLCSVVVNMSETVACRDILQPKKRKRQVHKKELIKSAKVKGEEHVNHAGKRINAKAVGDDCR